MHLSFERVNFRTPESVWLITNNTNYNDRTVLVCFEKDKIMHFGYTSSFDLLDELLPDFFPVCCDSDGDVLQVSLHLTLGGGTRARAHFTTARVHARAGKRGLMHLNMSLIYICHFIPSFASCEMNSSASATLWGSDTPNFLSYQCIGWKWDHNSQRLMYFFTRTISQ